MSLVLVVIAAAVIAYARWRWSLRRHPYAPCRRCVGRSGKNPGSNRERWGKCGYCGGTGKRLRLGARER